MSRRVLTLVSALASAFVLLCPPLAMAQAAPDPTQFQIAPPPEDAQKNMGLKASVGIDAFDRRRAAPGSPNAALRSVLDYRKEWRVTDRLALTLSDRLEWLLDDVDHGGKVRNAFREGYVSVGLNDGINESWFADAGRINLRSGVGLGFNPSDWLREGASLPQITQNPAAQRENRLGTMMLKLQAVERWGAAHVALIPRLANRPSETSPYGLDFGRTNEDPALHVRLAPQVSERLSIDALAYARRGRNPQWGLNASAVLNDALIAHVEWAVGRREGLTGPSQQHLSPRHHRLHHRLATGLSWTASNGTVIAIERQLSTDALNRADWDAWRLSTDAATARRLGQLRAERTAQQDPLVRDAWFARVALSGALKDPDIDLSALVRLNPHDRSRLWQLDGSWHAGEHLSMHTTLGGFAGGERSEFGANALRRFVAMRVELAY